MRSRSILWVLWALACDGAAAPSEPVEAKEERAASAAVAAPKPALERTPVADADAGADADIDADADADAVADPAALADPPTAFSLLAQREGEMWLHPTGDGTVLLSAGVEILALEPGIALARHPERLRGLVPPDPTNRWTTVTVGGWWPDATAMVVHEFFGCTDPIDKAYRWSGDRWSLVMPQRDPVSLTFAEVFPFAKRSVLARSVWELSDEKRFENDCDEGEVPRALKKELAKPRPRHQVVAADGSLTRAPDLAGERLVSTPTGDLFAIDGGTLLELAAGATTPKRHALPAAFAKAARIAHVGAKEIYVVAEDPVALAVFAKDWTTIPLPEGVTGVESISGGGDVPLWIASVKEREEDEPERALWRRVDATWTRMLLPTVAFPKGATGGWFPDEAAIPLAPWQVAVQSDDVVWVLGYHPVGGDGISAVFGTKPVETALVVPGYEAQREEAVAQNKR